MRIGCCISSADQLRPLAAAGAQYSELPVATVVMGEGADVEDVASRVASAAVPSLASNVFLPGSLAIVGPSVDWPALEAYVSTALDRLQRLGVRVLVLGSGRSRTVPEGFDRATALDQLERFARHAAEAAARRGVVVVLEPLRTAETNLVNSVAEGAAFIRARETGPLRLLADLYHMREEGEDLAVIGDCADLLSHVHVAGPARVPPGPGDAGLEEFLRRLQAAGYEGDCSVECNWSDFDTEVAGALASVREAAATAGWVAA